MSFTTQTCCQVRAALRRHARLVFCPREAMNGRNDKAAITSESEGKAMIKIWGRNTSVNVQKVMWAVGELELPQRPNHIRGPFGQNQEPAYLGKDSNGLVPTLEEDGFLLWESN